MAHANKRRSRDGTLLTIPNHFQYGKRSNTALLTKNAALVCENQKLAAEKENLLRQNQKLIAINAELVAENQCLSAEIRQLRRRKTSKSPRQVQTAPYVPTSTDTI
jgi:hypothetical protein